MVLSLQLNPERFEHTPAGGGGGGVTVRAPCTVGDNKMVHIPHPSPPCPRKKTVVWTKALCSTPAEDTSSERRGYIIDVEVFLQFGWSRL